MRAHSSRHGTTRSISARNCARRVVFVYFSKPVPASVSCERVFINTSRSGVMWLLASQHNARESGRLIQRFLRVVLSSLHRRSLSLTANRKRPSRLWKFQVVEQLHAALGSAATARRVGKRSRPSLRCLILLNRGRG